MVRRTWVTMEEMAGSIELSVNWSNLSMALSGPARSEQLLMPREYRIAALAFYSVLLTIGVAVNLAALWVFALTTKRRSSVTVYMINVAAVDLLFLLLLPFRMASYARDGAWPFGDAFCRVSAALTVFYPCVALWLFALISADRYVAVVQPRHSRGLKSVPQALAGCAGVWVMTLGGTAPLLFPGDDDPDHRGAAGFATCLKLSDVVVHLRRGNNAVDLVRLVFFFLVPVCVMIGCYAAIVDNLIRGRTSRLKPKVKEKSVRIIVTLIVQVLVCFVPFHVCLLVLPVADADGGGGGAGYFGVWAAFATFLMSLSTVLDVVLYYIVSKQFQDRVISVILYRNYLRSVRRKRGHRAHTGSARSLSNLNSAVI